MKYCGQALIHSYFTESMLPWIAAEINLTSPVFEHASIKVRNDVIDVEKTNLSPAVKNKSEEACEIPCNDLITFNDNDGMESIMQSGTDDTLSSHSHCIMEHVFQCTYAQIVHVTVIILHQQSPRLAILFRESKDSPILSHMFSSDDPNLMFKVLNVIKARISQKRKNGMHCDMTSYVRWNGEDTDSVRFEVMLLGVVNLKNPNPAHCLIDEAVAKYQNEQPVSARHNSEQDKMLKLDSTNNNVGTAYESSLAPLNSLIDDSREGAWQLMKNLDARQRCNSVGQAQKPMVRRRQRHSSEPSSYSANLQKSKIRLFQIGKDAIKLFCPAKSIRPFEIEFSNISRCMQGIVNRDHFGIIANKIDHSATQQQSHTVNDSKNKKFSCYIYKCNEDYVCEEIMQGIKQAFLTCMDNASPMRDYDLLCKNVNAVSVQDALAIVKQSMRKLTDSEIEILKAQLLELKPQTQREKLASVMGSLRHMYEVKQVEHMKEIQKVQPFEHQPAITVTKTFDNIRSKAKNSFESLLQRGKKKMQELQLDAEHFSERNIISPVDKLKFFADTLSHSSPNTPQKQNRKNNEPLTDFGFTRDKSKHSSGDIDLATDENKELYYRKIFKDIAITSSSHIDGTLPHCKRKIVVEKETKKSPQEIRELWKWAIQQQLLLQKINKVDKTQLAAFKTSPLHYIDLTPIPQDMVVIWDEIFQMSPDEKRGLDDKVLCAAIKTGILNNDRGRVWKLFRCRWQDNKESVWESIMKEESYEIVLENLTPYQHAILIDIGRTFPSHPMYCQQLGTGQLSLFNVLKAYSLLDEEVGYCQGLSFIAGILLMHTCVEREAYQLLCCLMYDVGCRNMYLPDMKGMKLAVYKVTRLLYDMDQDIYIFFEKHQVSMMLVATPWFLTMFASSFPLHFVSRVFDMVFFEGSSALFKIAVSLLQQHKNKIMVCEDFEDIVNYIRSQLPESDVQTMKEVIERAMTMNINNVLQDYEVEYKVLQEGTIIAKQKMDKIKSLEEDIHCLQQVNQKVTESNCDLLQQLNEAQQKIASLQKLLKDNSAMQPKLP